MPRLVRIVRSESPGTGGTREDDPTIVSLAIGAIKAAFAGLVALVAFIGGGSLFDLFPNLQPVTSRSVSVEAISIEPAVTMGQYASHSTVVRGAVSYEPNKGSCGEIVGESGEWRPDPARASEPGIAVTFLLDFTGFAGRCLVVEPVLFDAATMTRLPGPIEIFSVVEADKREADQAGHELWISEQAVPEPFVLRLLVFDGDAGHLLTYRDSAPICPPGYLPCPGGTSAPTEAVPSPS